VPHVCTGEAGALHGLNKIGRSPAPLHLPAEPANPVQRIYPLLQQDNPAEPALPARQSKETAGQLGTLPLQFCFPAVERVSETTLDPEFLLPLTISSEGKGGASP
jgi:hypothetical protein